MSTNQQEKAIRTNRKVDKNSAVYEKDTKIADKYMKSYSTSLGLMGMQIKMLML